MSAKSILEADGKAILNYHLTRAPVIKPTPLPPSATHNPPPRLASIHFPEDADVADVLNQAEATYPWLLAPGAKFVAKPDQLIKRRGKSGLLALNKTWPEAKEWVSQRAGQPVQVETVKGVLRQFLVEPFVPHPSDTEYYININSVREVGSSHCDYRLWLATAVLMRSCRETGYSSPTRVVSTWETLTPRPKRSCCQWTPQSSLRTRYWPERCWARCPRACTMSSWTLSADYMPSTSNASSRESAAPFPRSRYISLSRLTMMANQCSYLEINPLVVIPNAEGTSAEVHFLDLAAKLDQTAEFECGVKWAIARSSSALGLASAHMVDGRVTIDAGPPMEFPAPFGRELSKEEAYIAELDAKTGASLKLTVLNPEGRIWTLVAGGGASVVYADAIASAGFANELANYGEYSGAPTETQTFHYARTVLDLMLRSAIRPEGKVLFIGGGIANFTNVCTPPPSPALFFGWSLVSRLIRPPPFSIPFPSRPIPSCPLFA